MNKTITISTDTSTLFSQINIGGLNLQDQNSLRVFWQNYTNEFSEEDDTIHLPLFALKRSLLKLTGFFKSNEINLRFDPFTKRIIQSFLNDRKCFKTQSSGLNVTKEVIEDNLKSSGFDRTLKEEQIRDSILLTNLCHGANFSVPGAGKTTTLLAIHQILKRTGILDKLFVVAPINAFISWESEINEIYPGNALNVLRITKEYLTNYQKLKVESADVLLINYEKFRSDISGLRKFFIENRVHFVLDESHRIKSGFQNLSYRNIIELADVSVRRDIMSGTPMPQIYLDLIPQFEFVWPGEIIIDPKYTEKSDREIIIPILNDTLNGLYARTKKIELDLKPPIINYELIELGPLQSELYNLIKSEYARTLAGMDQEGKQYFRKLGRSVVRLLQASTNPMLLTTNDVFEDEIDELPENTEIWEVLNQFSLYEKPAKIQGVIDRVKQLIGQRRKVVIWSSFVRNILLLKRLLNKYNPAVIYGAVSTGDEEDVTSREGQIRMFHNDPSCMILIANPQACGEGISLHKVCHNAIYLDRNFNAAHYLQSMDRIHRLGLSREIETTIDIFISKSTIDEPLINRLNNKIEAMGEVLNDESLLELVYDPADIIEDDLDNKDVAVIESHINGSNG